MEGKIMGRRKGSKNKKPTIDPLHTAMTAEERLEFIARLIVERIETDQANESVDIHKIVAYVKYFMEHLHELLLDLCNPTLKAQYFSVLFDKAPTYEEIKSGTQKESELPEVNELFKALNMQSSHLVISPGIEPGLPG